MSSRNFLFIMNLCIGIVLSINVNAQTIIPQDIPSPNAMSLGRYGEIPVSPYTGTADISIPLYTLHSRDVEMPLSLVYDASGVQMNTLPGWIGHNWTLQAGGVITRTTNQICDETRYPSPNIYNIKSPKNYFQTHSMLPAMLATGNYDGIRDSALVRDMAPDVFSFNFMGKSENSFWVTTDSGKSIANLTLKLSLI